jgi:hypothetical protein
LLQLTGAGTIAAALRFCARHVRETLRLIGLYSSRPRFRFRAAYADRLPSCAL